MNTTNENTTEPDTAVIEGADQEPTTDTPEPDQEPEQEHDETAGNKAAREAARYRRQLREVEAERDALRETVTALQKAQVESLVSGVLRKPGALWKVGTELGDLLSEDGSVDVDAALSAARAAARDLGIIEQSPMGNVGDPIPGRPENEGMTWQAALRR